MGDRVRVEHLGQITGDADSTNAGPWYISGAFEPDCLERLDGLRKSLAQDMRRPTAVRRYADPRSAARAGDFGRTHDTQLRAHTNTHEHTQHSHIVRACTHPQAPACWAT